MLKSVGVQIASNTIRIGTAVNTGGFKKGFRDAAKQLNSFEKKIVDWGGKVRRSTSNVVDGFAKVGFAVTGLKATIGSLANVAAKPIKLFAEAESTATSMEVLTGSLQTATSLITQLRKIGSETPFEFTDLSNASKTLLSFGRSANVVINEVEMLSNIAQGDANKLGSLSLVFGQIAANAKLTGGDLLQLINVGFNPLNEIAAKTGESMSELRDRMSKGAISFDEVKEAFVSATSEGGKFYNMNEKQSKTTLGLWSTFKDGINQMLLQVGESMQKNMDIKQLISDMIARTKTFADYFIPRFEIAIQVTAKLYEWLSYLSPIFKALIPVLAGVVAGVMAYVAAQKVAAIATSTVLALSGQWGKLAAGLAIAAASGYAVNKALDAVVEKANKAGDAAKVAADGIKEIGKAAKQSKVDTSQLNQELEKQKKAFENSKAFDQKIFDLIRQNNIASVRRTEEQYEERDLRNTEGITNLQIKEYFSLKKALEKINDENERLKESKSFADNWIDSLKTEAEIYAEEIDKLRQAMADGFLTVADYDKAVAKLDEERNQKNNEPDLSPSSNLFDVAEFGSQAARTSIIRHQLGIEKNREEQEIAKNTKATNEILSDYTKDFGEFKRAFYGEPKTEYAI